MQTTPKKSFGNFKKPVEQKPAFDPYEIERLAAEADGIDLDADCVFRKLPEDDISRLEVQMIGGVPFVETDLFEPEQKLSDEEAQAVIAQTVAALTNANRLATAEEATDASKVVAGEKWIASLPEHARRALNNLARMFGDASLDEMFNRRTPEGVKTVVEEILMLDLTRIWKSYHEI